jgi:hypothetical protein
VTDAEFIEGYEAALPEIVAFERLLAAVRIRYREALRREAARRAERAVSA